MADKIKILIIEDDADISNLLRRIAGESGYETRQAFSGTEGLLYIKQEEWDLVLLDLMLPGMSGENVLAEIRRDKFMPVIIISAKTDKDDKLEALRIGADDYITKPFDIDEAAARINAQLRRFTRFPGMSRGAALLRSGGLSLNTETREVFLDGAPISLTAHEFDVLQLLMAHPSKVFTRANIFEHVWKDDFLKDDNTINVHISNIRTKLAAASPGCEYIKTVWGVGFKIAKQS